MLRPFFRYDPSGSWRNGKWYEGGPSRSTGIDLDDDDDDGRRGISKWENVTARSQVRDDGQAHGEGIRPQEAGFFAGRYILQNAAAGLLGFGLAAVALA
jgi:hypothetical protein